MEVVDQLKEWLEGTPMHNNEQEVCCPDYSCCIGEKHMAEPPERQAFYNAYIKGNYPILLTMMNIFLYIAVQNGLRFVKDEPIKP